MDESAGLLELSSLREMASSNSLQELENGIKTGLEILKDIETIFNNAKTVAEMADWIKKVEALRSQVDHQRTVVGVVGSTGAGKSSVINAVLDEECLVPTSCIRACTSVITEIAYNDCDEPDERCRAEVHFISSDDWVKELNSMVDDLQAAPVSPGAEHPSSEESDGVVLDKIRAIYPSLTSQ